MKQKSFTLIELLVVIAIVGLLASVVLVSMMGARDKARIARGLDFSHSIQHVLGAYAVGWWGFETIEAGNQVVDGSGHGNHGTVNGATLVPGLEQIGNALSFNGTSDYVNCGDDVLLRPGGGNKTFELWAMRGSGAGDFGLISKGNLYMNKRGSYVFYYDDNLFKVYYQSSDMQTWSGAPAAGVWVHLALVADNVKDELTLYKNGVSLGTYSYTMETTDARTDAFLIGAINFGGLERFHYGQIDEVRVYDRDLSATEIQKHYSEGLEKHQDLAIR